MEIFYDEWSNCGNLTLIGGSLTTGYFDFGGGWGSTNESLLTRNDFCVNTDLMAHIVHYAVKPSKDVLRALKPGDKVWAIDPWRNNVRTTIVKGPDDQLRIRFRDGREWKQALISEEDAFADWQNFYELRYKPKVEGALTRRSIRERGY